MIMITNGVITHVNITDYPKKLDMIWYDAKNNQLIVCKSLPYADKDQKYYKINDDWYGRFEFIDYL